MLSMSILNNIFKSIEPAASEIIKNVSKELFVEKSKEEVKKDYIQPILAQAVNTASIMAINQLKRMGNSSSPNLSEYEVAQREKYTHTF